MKSNQLAKDQLCAKQERNRQQFDFALHGQRIESRNAEGQLHCEDGPALRTFTFVAYYIDGQRHGPIADIYGSLAYFYKNMRVPQKFHLHPEQLTFEEIITHPNAEVRRAGCEIYGFERMIDEGKFELINADDETKAKLFKAHISADGEEPEELTIVRVIDGTPHPKTGVCKEYILPVPHRMKTCKEAIAWTFYKDEEEYAPAVET